MTREEALAEWEQELGYLRTLGNPISADDVVDMINNIYNSLKEKQCTK